MTPDCMTPDELALWQEANRILDQRRAGADAPCRDCPMQFALEMRAQGCCNGQPARAGKLQVFAENPRVAHRRAQWREASRRRYARMKAA